MFFDVLCSEHRIYISCLVYRKTAHLKILRRLIERLLLGTFYDSEFSRNFEWILFYQ